jgi:hypothetical protein
MHFYPDHSLFVPSTLELCLHPDHSFWVLSYLHPEYHFFVCSITARNCIGLVCIYEKQRGSLIRSRNCLQFASTWVLPQYFGGIRGAPLFSCLCCPIVFLYVLSSVLRSPLRFPHRNDVRCVLTSSCSYESSRLIYVICVCLRLVVSKAYCVVYLLCCLCCSSSCLTCVAIFSGLSFFIVPFGIL